jgi:alpha-beta hydrolase superfamily lysophospholipase
MRSHSDRLPTRDGLALPTRSWLPNEPGSERAALVVVHGLGEHIGRYDRLATRLVREGYAVHGFDQRGHGYAPGVRCNVRRFEEFVDDLADFFALVQPLHPGKQLVLFGHSMGGVIAARAVQTAAVSPHLLLLSSPAFRDGAEVPGWARRLLGAIARPLPGFPTVRLASSLLSRDPAEVAAYDRDPAVFHGPIKARIATEMGRAGADAIRDASKIQVPLLLLHGAADGLAQPTGSAALMAKLSGCDAEFQLYPEGPHELFNDPGRERVIGDLLRWLKARTEGGSQRPAEPRAP